MKQCARMVRPASGCEPVDEEPSASVARGVDRRRDSPVRSLPTLASLLTNFTYGWRRGRGDTGIPCAPGLFYGLVGVLGLFLAAAEDASENVNKSRPSRTVHRCERLPLPVVTACKLYFGHDLTLVLDQYEDSEEVQEGAGNKEKGRQTQAVRHL